jgi:phosphate transport system substrate-binding protein
MPKSNVSRAILALALAAAAAAGTLAVATAGAAPAKRTDTVLQGAGSSLVAPALAVWQPLYSRARGVTVNYSSIGSGGGIAAITARTVDFGASDAPLTPDQATACKDCIQIPWVLTATVPVYNIPGIKDIQLRLDGPTLAGIFLGRIKTWNDPAIRKLNPSLSLPATAITTVHRSDGSGDTYVFTDYLSKVSKVWKNEVGSSTSVSWPGGVGGKGNSGVAGVVASTPGSIGYVSDAYVIQNHLAKARLKNAFGHYTLPSIRSIGQAAALVKTAPADMNISITNPPKSAKYRDAWPLSTFSYIVVPHTTDKAKTIKNFVSWALTHGQPSIEKYVFAPMPLVMVKAAEKALAKVHS